MSQTAKELREWIQQNRMDISAGEREFLHAVADHMEENPNFCFGQVFTAGGSLMRAR